MARATFIGISGCIGGSWSWLSSGGGSVVEVVAAAGAKW